MTASTPAGVGAAGVQGAIAGENREAAASTAGATPAVNKGELFSSFDVNAFEIPSGRDELWRFTPMRRLRGLHDGTATPNSKVGIEVTETKGVTVESVGRDDQRLGEAGAPTDRVAAAAYSGFEQATVITVGREEEVADPITVTVTGPGAGNVAYAHLQIRVEAFGRATVVLDHKGDGTIADNVEFIIGDSARLSVVSVQDWAETAVHARSEHTKVGRDAVFRHFAVSLGGDLARTSTTVRFSAPGGDAELFGLYFADAGQHIEHRLLVDHAVPHCKSNVVYKGALQGESAAAHAAPGSKGDAHTVWIGDVLIRAAAEGTETFELNRNLVLTDGARADSVPNLEIETGEIRGAGHASATGRFDDEQLFYLRSRGIPEDQARRLVVRGFFRELIDKIAVPDVRERIDAAIEAELGAIGA
ncbi:Fe-S cluster assembly protein SufD [Hoyosella altamirensis]|uniref:Fe-S cluster assembly protein SufD n=1 Tax=Hoyosella altamirensis TaxID=616997 RepID=A0A839RSN1_9ACTN|nr:Fe-S cluster assembly protein SufD [Hoyosella altamirensis]MBB3039875.1 Fe-S cluster assembly protein SufD [Hoyosella altamirensis]